MRLVFFCFLIIFVSLCVRVCVSESLSSIIILFFFGLFWFVAIKVLFNFKSNLRSLII